MNYWRLVPQKRIHPADRGGDGTDFLVHSGAFLHCPSPFGGTLARPLVLFPHNALLWTPLFSRPFSLSFLLFDSYYSAQAGFELLILLSQLSDEIIIMCHNAWPLSLVCACMYMLCVCMQCVYVYAVCIPYVSACNCVLGGSLRGYLPSALFPGNRFSH